MAQNSLPGSCRNTRMGIYARFSRATAVECRRARLPTRRGLGVRMDVHLDTRT